MRNLKLLENIQMNSEINFRFRQGHRESRPIKHVLICEDNLALQSRTAAYLSTLFQADGLVQFSFVPGSLAASSVIHFCKVDLVILDDDMPDGNGQELLDWMDKYEIRIPVITFFKRAGSIEPDPMQFARDAFLDGAAKSLILQTLGFPA